MRRIFVVNGVLLVIASVLFSIDRWCDRESLLGCNVKSEALLGRQMEDLLDGQPVIPDKILVLRYDIIGFSYKRDNTVWHDYPYIEVGFHNERVLSADIRIR